MPNGFGPEQVSKPFSMDQMTYGVFNRTKCLLTNKIKQNQQHLYTFLMGLLWGLSGKESTCNAGDAGSIPGSGRFPGGGNGNPFQYSCLQNPMAEESGGLHIVHGVAKSGTWLKWLSSHIPHTHLLNKAFTYNTLFFEVVDIIIILQLKWIA